MTERKLVQEFIIHARYGKAFVVKKGQLFRVYQVEGEQVADCAFWNADDYREVYHTGTTVILNELLGTYNRRWVKHLFSKPPRE
ncbi:MAG: DUF1989 domain-containing protein, partial [Chloroflexi bacterium]|nr:DUF1989 domain-containing protein [Chloroflexota bacterium]